MQTRRAIRAVNTRIKSWLKGSLAIQTHLDQGRDQSPSRLRQPLITTPPLLNTGRGLDSGTWDQEEAIGTAHPGDPELGFYGRNPASDITSQDISGFTTPRSQLGALGLRPGFSDRASDVTGSYAAASVEPSMIGHTGLLRGYEAVSTGDSAAGTAGFTRRVHPAPPSWPAGSTTTTRTAATTSSRAESELPLGFKPYSGDPLGLVVTAPASTASGSASDISNSSGRSRAVAGEAAAVHGEAAAAGALAAGIGREGLREYAAVPGSLVSRASSSSNGSESSSAAASAKPGSRTTVSDQHQELAAAAGAEAHAAAAASGRSSHTSSTRRSSSSIISSVAATTADVGGGGDGCSVTESDSRSSSGLRLDEVEARRPLLPRGAQRSYP